MIEVISYRPSDESVEPSATGYLVTEDKGYVATDYSVSTLPPLPGDAATREAVQIGDITSGNCIEVTLPLAKGRVIERVILTELENGGVLVDLGDFLFVLTQSNPILAMKATK